MKVKTRRHLKERKTEEGIEDVVAEEAEEGAEEEVEVADPDVGSSQNVLGMTLKKIWTPTQVWRYFYFFLKVFIDKKALFD